MVSGLTDRRQVSGEEQETKGKRERPGGKIAVKKVFICSPFRPTGRSREEMRKDLKKNISLAKEACRYAVGKGFVPYAPHLYFPAFLSDADIGERELGILLGLSWLAGCDEVWIAGVRISRGMSREIAMAMDWGIPIKSYLPLTHRKEKVFDVDFCTEDEFFRKFGEE